MRRSVLALAGLLSTALFSQHASAQTAMYVCLIRKPALERRDHLRFPGPRRTLDDRDVWRVHRDEQCLLLALRRTPFAELSENVPRYLGIPLLAQDVRIVALKEVIPEDELMMITRQGVIIRLPVDGIRVIGRNTQGVKVMNLDSGDTVVDVARVVKEDEAGAEEVAAGDGTGPVAAED